MVAAAEHIHVVEDVVEVVEGFAYPVSGVQRPGLPIGSVKIGAEAAKQFGHGQIRLAVSVVDGGIEDHGVALGVVEQISAPEIAVQQGGLRPMLQQDGGDLELIDVDGDRVLVAMRGTCSSCPSSGLTLKGGIEAKLKELVHSDVVVEEVAG